MNCDQVFDVLTRGPFPSGASHDADIELHLEACHDCRQLADALRPAVDMFHEAVPHDEYDDLPGYRGSLRESEAQSLPLAVATMLDRASAEASATCERRRKVTSEMSSWRLTAACLLVLALAGLLWSVNSNSHDDWVFKGSNVPRPEQVQFQPDADGLLQLAKLELSDDCVPGPHQGQFGATTSAGDPNDEGFQTQHFVCCTHCHHAAYSQSQPSPPHTISVAMAACTACHE